MNILLKRLAHLDRRQVLHSRGQRCWCRRGGGGSRSGRGRGAGSSAARPTRRCTRSRPATRSLLQPRGARRWSSTRPRLGPAAWRSSGAGCGDLLGCSGTRRSIRLLCQALSEQIPLKIMTEAVNTYLAIISKLMALLI